MQLTRITSRLATLCLLLLFAAVPNAAHAHELKPAIVTLSAPQTNLVRLSITLNLESFIAGIGPQHTNSTTAPEANHYNDLRALPADQLKAKFDSDTFLKSIALKLDGHVVPLTLDAVIIPRAGNIKFARTSVLTLSARTHGTKHAATWSTTPPFADSIFRIKNPNGITIHSAFVTSGKNSPPLATTGNPNSGITLSTISNYIKVGFSHIIPKGIDHILFVLGLFLMSRHWRPLLIQVTAFTIAHSITLALGLYAVITLSPDIVEPLIAASIVFVALENLLTDKLTPWRPFIVFAFGLLHGLGFASVLQEVGLPQSNTLSALIGFNIGVELGQIAVIAAAYVLVAVCFQNESAYRRNIVVPGSLIIAVIAAYWTVERTGLLS